MKQNENIKELVQLISGFVCVDGLFLFGSHATRRATPASDIGIAGNAKMIQESVPSMCAIAAAAGFDNINLVPLASAPPLLQHEIVKHNRILYERHGFDAADLVSRLNRQFFDMRPTLRLHAAAYEKRILHGAA